MTRLATLAVLLAVLGGFPRLGQYSSAAGGGGPYLRADGTVDMTVVRNSARFDVLVVHASPFTEYRHDVLDSLRHVNPRIQLLAYVNGMVRWYNPHPAIGDTLSQLWWLWYAAVRDAGGALYSTDGSEQGIDYSNPAIAPTLASLLVARIVQTGLWDGLFLDGPCSDGPLVWTGSVDWKRAGWTSEAQFDSAWKAGTRKFGALLRSGAPSGYPLVANCGAGRAREYWNGAMRENFPHQEGGNWWSNMVPNAFGAGYLADDTLYLHPTMCWLTSWPQGVWQETRPYSPENLRRQRFGLASASLAGGLHSFTIGSQGYTDWWFPEFAVTPKGNASTNPYWKGWLGRPRGECWKTAEGLWRRQFERGTVLVNPGPGPISIRLEDRYQRIRSSLDRAVYSGETSVRATVPAGDALFLIRR
jgi:hypothetical protein